MKFKGHESFFIRKGWLFKGMRKLEDDNGIFSAKDAMERLGLGSNMVRSLRYWMQTTGLTTENKTGKRVQTKTPLGDLIWQYDRHTEETGTLWALQYNLATNKDQATSWYLFFNKFKMREFQKADFVQFVAKEAAAANEAKAISSYESDFDCIINTYIPHSDFKGISDPEENIDCPLGELGLIKIVDKKKKIYRKMAPSKEKLPLVILMATISDLYPSQDEISIDHLLHGNGNICGLGNIYNLDMVLLMSMLYDLEKSGYIRVVRTAGLDVIRINRKETSYTWLKAYYEALIN